MLIGPGSCVKWLFVGRGGGGEELMKILTQFATVFLAAASAPFRWFQCGPTDLLQLYSEALTGRVRGQNKNVELWKLFAGDNNTIMCREVVCAS